MKDNRSSKVKAICEQYAPPPAHCKGCPLMKPCDYHPGDDKDIYDQRMNDAAEQLQENAA